METSSAASAIILACCAVITPPANASAVVGNHSSRPATLTSRFALPRDSRNLSRTASAAPASPRRPAMGTHGLGLQRRQRRLGATHQTKPLVETLTAQRAEPLTQHPQHRRQPSSRILGSPRRAHTPTPTQHRRTTGGVLPRGTGFTVHTRRRTANKTPTRGIDFTVHPSRRTASQAVAGQPVAIQPAAVEPVAVRDRRHRRPGSPPTRGSRCARRALGACRQRGIPSGVDHADRRGIAAVGTVGAVAEEGGIGHWSLPAGVRSDSGRLPSTSRSGKTDPAANGVSDRYPLLY